MRLTESLSEESPAAVRYGGGADCHPDVGCITCGDEGIEMNAVEVDAPTGIAVCVDAEGSRSEVDLGIVSGVRPGDSLLVHAGVALVRLDSGGTG